MGLALLLILLYSITHFFFDFVFTWEKLTYSKMHGGEPVSPLVYHSLLQAAGFFFVSVFFTQELSLLLIVFLFQFFAHLMTDVLKAFISQKHSLSIFNKNYWVVLGADQLAHQLAMVGIAYMVMYYR